MKNLLFLTCLLAFTATSVMADVTPINSHNEIETVHITVDGTSCFVVETISYNEVAFTLSSCDVAFDYVLSDSNVAFEETDCTCSDVLINSFSSDYSWHYLNEHRFLNTFSFNSNQNNHYIGFDLSKCYKGKPVDDTLFKHQHASWHKEGIAISHT